MQVTITNHAHTSFVKALWAILQFICWYRNWANMKSFKLIQTKCFFELSKIKILPTIFHTTRFVLNVQLLVVSLGDGTVYVVLVLVVHVVNQQVEVCLYFGNLLTTYNNTKWKIYTGVLISEQFGYRDQPPVPIPRPLFGYRGGLGIRTK